MLVYPTILAALLVVIDGLPKYKYRVSLGNGDSIEFRPYMVSIRYGALPQCGGSIISRNVVLTAAHCFRADRNVSDVSVHSGSSRFDLEGTRHTVVDYVVHENYTRVKHAKYGSSAYNDVAILRVSPAFEFNARVQPISLFDAAEKIPKGSRGTVSGWGVPSFDETIISHDASLMRSVDLPILDSELCATLHAIREDYVQKPGEMCAAAENGKGPCLYDSGGPLVVRGRQVGVTSWITGYCGDSAQDALSVYSEVAYFRGWIDEKMKIFDEMH